MDTLSKGILIVHTLIALGIITLVLLQRGKGADAGAGFGAGASGTVFGARGSGSFFSRATAVMATLFFVSSLTLAYLSSQQAVAPDSLLEGAPVVEEEAEAIPADAEDLPVPDIPSLESAEGEAGDLPAIDEDMPSLEEGEPAPEGSE